MSDSESSFSDGELQPTFLAKLTASQLGKQKFKGGATHDHSDDDAQSTSSAASFERSGARRGAAEWQEEEPSAKLPLKVGGGLVIAPTGEHSVHHPRAMSQAVAAGAEAAQAAQVQAAAAEAIGAVPSQAVPPPKHDRTAKAKSLLARASVQGLSEERLLARRRRRQLEIAELAEQMLEAPERSFSAPQGSRARQDPSGSKLDREDRASALYELCLDGDAVVRAAAAASLTAVYCDVLPSYRIRLATEAEREVKLKKDVKRLRDYEESLLAAYQKFLQLLEITVGLYDAVHSATGEELAAEHRKVAEAAADWNAKQAARRRAAMAEASTLLHWRGPAPIMKRLAMAALHQMSQLLMASPNFNFRTNILATLVARLDHREEPMAKAASQHLSRALASDPSCGLGAEAAKLILGLVSQRGSKLRASALAPLLALPLTKLVKHARAVASEKRKLKQALSKKSKQGSQEVESVLAGLASADAEDKEATATAQAAALTDVMLIYFKLLRGRNPGPIMPAVLRGLARYSHLIDVEVAGDLLLSLRDAAASDLAAEDRGSPASKLLPLAAGVQLVRTALRQVSGGASTVLNIDVTGFVVYLHRLLQRAARSGVSVGFSYTGRTAGHDDVALACQAVAASGADPVQAAALSAALDSADSSAQPLLGAMMSAVEASLLHRRENDLPLVIAVVKALLGIAVVAEPGAAVAVLTMTRALVARYPRARSVLEAPHHTAHVGAGAWKSWHPDALGTQRAAAAEAGASGSEGVLNPANLAARGEPPSAWETTLLARSFHPALAEAAVACASGAVPPARVAYDSLIQSYSFADGTFCPAPAMPKPPRVAAAWRQAMMRASKEGGSAQAAAQLAGANVDASEEDDAWTPAAHDPLAGGAEECAADNLVVVYSSKYGGAASGPSDPSPFLLSLEAGDSTHSGAAAAAVAGSTHAAPAAGKKRRRRGGRR